MPLQKFVQTVHDLLDPARNVLFGMSVDEAREIVRQGEPSRINAIDGQFALVARDGTTVRMARTIGRLMRYFIFKHADGPGLVISDRIDGIHQWLSERGMGDQFHPSYTRMVPAHYLVELRLLGCPDPNPTYRRFFAPEMGTQSTDLDVIGQRYVSRAYDETTKWLRSIPAGAPVGVFFSGGVDSGCIFLLTYRAMLDLSMNPARLKAFTLSVDGQGSDLAQARNFLKQLDLDVFHETIDVPRSYVDAEAAVKLIEDYKPLDVEAGAMAAALCRGVRERYPDWKYALDGDGGDENLKDYPIEENSELTIRSVINNRMLYQEGWGVESIKHSLTYSGGQSRGYARTYAPSAKYGFDSYSPFTSPRVIDAAEAIPFVKLTDYQTDRLYLLKGEIVSRGVQAVTGFDMPVFEKRRFQHGVMREENARSIFGGDEQTYRQMFHAQYA